MLWREHKPKLYVMKLVLANARKLTTMDGSQVDYLGNRVICSDSILHGSRSLGLDADSMELFPR